MQKITILAKFTLHDRVWKIVHVEECLFDTWVLSDQGNYYSPNEVASGILSEMEDPQYRKLPAALLEYLC